MRRFLMGILATALICPAISAQTVFEWDFTGDVPPEMDLGTWTQTPILTSPQGGETHTFVDVTTLGVSGQWAFTPDEASHTATLTLDNLPEHTSLNIDLFLGAGGGLDADVDGQDDRFEITVDGNSVFNEHFGGRLDGVRDAYGGSAPAEVVVLPMATNDSDGSDFIHRADGWGHDALYDLGMDDKLNGIPHTADSVTIQFLGNRSGGEGPDDEMFSMANLSVTLIPEPSTIALLSLGAMAIVQWVRRRRNA